MTFNILEVILTVFFAALIVSVLFRQLKLSVVLGYLLVGALVGPHAIGLVPNADYLYDLAEFGIVFLMFTVGLEFSIPKLFSLKHSVFVIGGLQVLLTVVLILLGAWILHFDLLSALVIGSIVAMSSTALVVKQLHDQFELRTSHGLNAVGVLLFQDIAVIPLIILIATFAKGSEHSLGLTLLWALFKGSIAILFIFLMGRWLLRPLFRYISKARSIELFTLSVLLVTLAAAWVTQSLGLSYAFGAFLAGMMLSETEFRHQIEAEIRPFRDILLALFFITIGMLTNVTLWDDTWFWILLLVLGLVLGKMILIILISLFARVSAPIAIRTGIVLAQGSEFGFAILALALENKVISEESGQIILAALLISMAISPLLIYFNKSITKLFLGKKSKSIETSQQEIAKQAKKLHDHVIICGYGRIGQHIARLLDKIHFPYIAIDSDADLVERASLAGDNIIYGDASHPDILRTAKLSEAKVLVVSVADHSEQIKILNTAREKRPKLPILARCRDKTELKHLKKLGATKIVAELFETSLTLSNHLLNAIQVPREQVNQLIQEIRNTDYDLLYKIFAGSLEEKLEAEEHLIPVVISENDHAVNHSLEELKLKELGVEVIAIRRNNERFLKPYSDMKIQANDIVVIFGSPTNLELAEQRLLQGDGK